LKEQGAAAVGSDLSRFKELDALIDDAADARDHARAAIRRHLAEDHGEE